MRRLLLLPALFLLAAAAPPKPAPPPAAGVKVSSTGGARRVDAVLPAKVLATAFPRGADGKRRVVALVATAPGGPRELYLIDTAGAGSETRLLGDLPARSIYLMTAPLHGDGADEIILREPEAFWSLGTAGSPTAPRPFLSGAGTGRLLLGALGNREIATAEVGRLRTWTRDGDGTLRLGASAELPVRATRERTALRLDTPDVETLGQGGGAPPLYLAGPEANGKTRLHTSILARDAEGNLQQSEAWSRFAGPETVRHHWFVRVDGQPMLIVATTNAEKLSIFEEQSLRVFALTADRSRAGQPPRLSVPTVSRRWFPVRPFVLDLDHDGHDDLAVVQQEGLRGKALAGEIWFGQGQGRFATPSHKVSLSVQASTWEFGADVTGDGRPDLVAVADPKLLVFAGTDPHRDLFDRRPRLSLDLSLSERVTFTIYAGSEGATVDSTGTNPLRLVDLDGDGRSCIVLTVRDDNGRGRVTVVRLGG